MSHNYRLIVINTYLSETLFERKYIPQEFPFHEAPPGHSQINSRLFQFVGQGQFLKVNN